MKSIDIHTHAFPDKLAERAIEALESDCPWKAIADGTIGSLLASMDAAEVQASAICSIATKAEQAEPILKWSEKIRSDRIIPLPSVHPTTPDAPGWIERFAEAGMKGVKLHPMYQDFNIDDPSMMDVYRRVRECGLFIVTHAGQDIAFPPEDDRAAPQRLRRVIDQVPGLKLICAHLGGWQQWDRVEEYLVGSEVYLETSFSLQFIDGDQARRIIEHHGVDRVMTGSDWPWAGQKENVGFVEALELEEADTRKILYENAAALLGMN